MSFWLGQSQGRSDLPAPFGATSKVAVPRQGDAPCLWDDLREDLQEPHWFSMGFPIKK